MEFSPISKPVQGLPIDTPARARLLQGRLASLARSLEVYWGDADRLQRMDALYERYVAAGALVFDIGAHVGDRIGAFRRLGARVVALEPQHDCCAILSEIFAGDGDVTILEAACGASEGRMTLHVNSANATVATLSDEFVRAAEGAVGWEGETWDLSREIRVTTLDALIAGHGLPAFVKIDVEGFEAEVLAGLSQPLPALSFEFTTIQRDVACACIDQLSALGCFRYNIALGESQAMTFADLVTSAEMRAHIAALPHAANSGDIYAITAE